MKIASMFRTSLLVAVAAIATGTAVLAPANAEVARSQQARPVDNEELDFELVNETGYAIAHLYLSPATKETWGENVLEDVLSDSGSVSLVFHPQATAKLWDLRADWQMAEGEESQEYVYWKNLDLTQISKMTLHYDEETDKTSATFE